MVNSIIFCLKEARARLSGILNERNLSCKIVKNCRIKGLNRARDGEGKRRNEFAEWHVAWLAEWHNYAEFNIRRSFSKK